jgi:hypothetical protein
MIRLQPVDFFLLKRRRFDFFKKIKIDPGDLVTRSKLENWALGRVDHQVGFKNSGKNLETNIAT